VNSECNPSVVDIVQLAFTLCSSTYKHAHDKTVIGYSLPIMDALKFLNLYSHVYMLSILKVFIKSALFQFF
jgi:hypothetical protein